MTGASQYTSLAVLNHMTGGIAMFPLPTVYMAMFTAVGSDDGTGFTEPSGGGYARVQVSGHALTNATTAIGSPVLNFASVPVWVTAGMYVYDVTTLGVIPAATRILSLTGTTVTLSANVVGSPVASGDQIVFTAFNPASGLAPSIISNASSIQFNAASSSWGTVFAWGLFDQLSTGNLLTWDYLGTYNWLPVEVSMASPAILTAKAHGYSNSDTFVYSIEYGGIVPTFSAGTFTGLLTVAGVTTDTFTSLNGVTAVNTSTTGSGMVRKVLSQVVNVGDRPLFMGGVPGGLLLSLA